MTRLLAEAKGRLGLASYAELHAGCPPELLGDRVVLPFTVARGFRKNRERGFSGSVARIWHGCDTAG